MGWDQIPPLDKVLANFLSMIEQARLGSSNGGSEPDEIAFIEIYHYLLKHINDNEALSMIKDALNSQPWILVNGTLHPTDRVTLNTSFDLAPHFVQIRSTGLEKLFLAMGVRNKIGQADLEGIISEIASQYGHDESLSDVDVELVVRILNHIAVHKAYWSSKLLVLTQDNRLRQVNEVVYDDLSQRGDVSLQEYDDSYTFVSNEIGYVAAVELHIPLYSARYWNDQTDSTFEPWAQEEDIVARIGNVLNDYDPSNLFLEFLQNAADAGATKCSFMLDERTFGRNKVLNGMAPWQGPALVVYNDAEFSENDFVALSKLGEGNKRDDSSKIGRHGLGFNSVYHFTDVPSVVSGSLIGFFDPLRENLPKAPSPEGPIGRGGQRCNFLRLRGEALSEQLEPYKGLFGCNMKSHFRGTIFRIPLRTVDTHNDGSKKSIINRQWTLLEIHAMLKKWTEDAKVGMLFLENMMNIEITTKSNNLSEGEGFSWSASKSFGTEKPHLDKALREGNDASNFTHVADIRVSSSEVTWRESQKWLIHTDLDYPEGTAREVRDLAKKNRWYTHRSVAIPLNWRSKVSFEGRLFTHLPTPIVTGVPFHLHGGFALTSNRKSLAGGADLTSPQSIWNQFMKLNCISQTAITAMQKLLKVLFWGLLKGSPKPREIDQATEAYFKFWPVKARPEFESFTKWFSRNTYENPVYPVRVVDQDYHVLFLPGRQVVFPELYGAPSAMSLMIRGYQRKNGVNISECPSAVQTRIRTDWKTDPELNFEALNEDAVRKMIKDDPQFIKKFVKIEDIRWILEYTLKTIMEPTKPVKVPVTGISLLPLMNKTWKPLAPSSGCYTAKAEMRELIHGGEYLIDESIFTTTISSPHTTEYVTVSKLEKIYKRLSGDTIYGLTQLPPAKFTSIFNSENPNGATEDQREKLWRLLDKSKDLEPYGELPILKTSNGDLIPLKYCKNGIEISRLQPQTRRCIEKLSRLMSDLNLVVFDSGQNKRHPYFVEAVPKVDGSTILKCISQRCKDWPEDRVITAEEAEVLREMIRADSVLNSQEAAPLGILRIWPTWGSIGSSNTLRLITARGSFFMEGNYSLEYFGDNSDVIQSNYCKHFAAMGAKSLNIVEAAKSRVMPRFLKKTLTCANRQTKSAYIRMLTDIIKVASAKKGQQAQQAKAFLLADQFILARDGNFHIGRELYDPDDELLASVFMDETSKFPDNQIWQALGSGSKKHLIGLRDRQDPTVIRECAFYVLGLTSSHLASSSSSTYIKALALVRHIYQNCGDLDWMDPVWRIVPADVTQSSPYNECIPDMEEYLSFSEIVDPFYRDICWTQCAFFPENLKPTESFKARFPSVGKPRIHSVVNHLQTLVEDLAPTWTSFDHQPILKMSLFKVYKYFDDISKEKGTPTKVALQKELANLTSPYILNGDDKDPSEPESWLWPNQLMLDIDNDIEMHKVVHHKLKSVRGFLVLAGVEQMRTVEGRVEVPEGRRKGDIESRLLNCFESQDMHNGFMDIKFLFADHKQILAHKFMIVHANDYFARRFTGAWAEFTTRDPLNPGVEVIDLSDMDGDETFEAFWGLLYYFYADNLINTNGPPSPATFEATIQPNVDLLRDRVQYLMGLLCLADQYQTPRLKALIALEIVGGQKVMHSNVFNVRKFAILYNSTDIKDHCEKYVSMNSSSVRTYLNGELQVYRQSLNELSGDDDGAQRAELNEDIRELEDNLRDLNTLA
ncbi:hypothetical protein BGZ46_001262 [Entomortierella lignicola]|nr:hypothetical protein BGZ46_001262 [Entomortierella lignicola]